MNLQLPIPIARLEELSERLRPEYPKNIETESARRTENLTLVDGKTFLSTNVAGDILPAGASDVGFFSHDTRFLSHLELRVNRRHAIVLSSSTEKTFLSQVELTAARATLRESFDLPENTVHIRRQQLLISNIFFDRLTFLNYNRTPVKVSVELRFDADFSDVFEVRGMKRSQHGKFYRPVQQGNCLIFVYRGLDNTLRQTVIQMSPAPTYIEESAGRWELELGAGRQEQIELNVVPVIGESGEKSSFSVHFSECLKTRRDRYAQWENNVTHFLQQPWDL